MVFINDFASFSHSVGYEFSLRIPKRINPKSPGNQKGLKSKIEALFSLRIKRIKVCITLVVR